MSGTKPKRAQHSEDYRGVNIQTHEHYGTWLPYINRKLIPNVAFATWNAAVNWCRREIDKELGKK